MGDMSSLGKILIILGGIAVFSGLILLGLGKVFPFGRLPGDIYYQRGNFTFYFPLMSGIIISLVLTLVLNLIFRR